ncbi:MAG: hypothetical protein ABR555_19865 [Pyrinomonadaceae bacterium]
MEFSNGWLAFELGVLRRLKFSSIAFPFTGEPNLGAQLKHWNVRVAANDPMLWSYLKASAVIENQFEWLDEAEIESLVDDAYVPRDTLENPGLLKWFNTTDSWWFDNLRFNADRLESFKRAIALTAGMMVGDYVLSFDEKTRGLREPLSLSKVFRQTLISLPRPFNNALRNKSANQDVRSFVAERHHTDLLFLRLPAPVIKNATGRDPMTAWREEWVRGTDDFWPEFDKQRGPRLGSPVQSKQQYLGFVEDLLRTASHIPAWAIAHIENGFISHEELVNMIVKVRKVESIYTKDFSDLLGVRASIAVARS